MGSGGDFHNRSPFEAKLGNPPKSQPLQIPLPPDEFFNKPIGGITQNGGRGTLLLQYSTHIENDNLVTQLQGLFDVVSDENDGLAKPLLEIEQLILQPVANDGIHRSERLVHQEHRRISRQCPSHPYPLLLTS